MFGFEADEQSAKQETKTMIARIMSVFKRSSSANRAEKEVRLSINLLIGSLRKPLIINDLRRFMERPALGFSRLEQFRQQKR